MPTTKSRYIGGALAFWSTHRKRLIDVIGEDVVKYIMEVGEPVDDTTGDLTRWTNTIVEAGAGDTTAVNANTVRPGLLVTTAANENDGQSSQLLGESFSLAAGNSLYFGARIKLNDVTQTDLFLGLAITDTAILGGVTDRIGFQSVDGDAGLDFVLEKGSAETKDEDVATLVDATEVYVEFFLDADGNVAIFIDGVEVSASAETNLPDDEELRVSFEYLTGEAVANNIEITDLRCIQIGVAVS